MNSKECIAKLKKLGAYDQFVENLKLRCPIISIEEYCKEYDKERSQSFGFDFIGGAFCWENTPEKFDFWGNIAYGSMNPYKEIVFTLGCTIDSAMETLKNCEVPACGSFNEVMLYSDVDDVESAYMKILGKTKEDFDAEMQKEKDRVAAKRLLTKLLEDDWVDLGLSTLDEEYHELWKKCVPIRLSDIYEGMELGACLDIVKQLNANYTFEAVKETIEKQGHSGMSYGLVCSMVKSFCKRGADFVKYLE